MNIFRAFMELDESYNDRQLMIDDLKRAGKHYNFNKYTDAQIYRIWQRLQNSRPNIIKEPKHELDLDFEPGVELPRCECGTLLSDAGFCPACHDGEEDLGEGIFDSGPVARTGFVSASGQQIKLPNRSNQMSKNTGQSSSPASIMSSDKYVVRIVSDHGRLRALATDGVHPAAWVSFPNSLRQFDGQKYEVDQLIWNGKNYRVAGNIVEI